MYVKKDSKPKFGRNAGSRDSRNAPGDPKKKRRKFPIMESTID